MTEKTAIIPPHRMHPLFIALLISIMLAVGVMVYSNTFDSPFLFDDELFIVIDPAIHMTELSWHSLKTAAFEGSPAHRYLPNISWALNFYFDRLNPFGYHLVNLIIHLLSGIFLFFFIKNILQVGSDDSRDAHPDLIAFFTALLWIVQPVGTQAVTYICQRMASMVAFFYILSLFFYARGRMARRQAPIDWLKPCLYFSGCILSLLCALGAKENAGTLPLVILLYEWFFFQELKLDWSRRQITWFSLFIIVFGSVILYFLGENPIHRILASYNIRDFSLMERVMTEWRVIIYYISLFLWSPPGRLNLDHDYPLSISLIDPPTTIIAFAAILGLLMLAVYSAEKDRLVAFCILWFFITQATESSIIGIELIFEHRTYIPFMMTSLLFVMTVFRLIRNRPAACSLLVTVAIVFSVWTYQRNQTWQDAVTLSADCVAKSPNKSRAYNNLGKSLLDTGDYAGAIAQLEKAIEIDPFNDYARYNICNALYGQGKIGDAILCYNQVIEFNPNFSSAHANLAKALLKQGNTSEAIKSFHRALDLNPEHFETHNNLANALMQNGDFGGAIEHFKIILKKYPDHVESNVNIGAALAKLGQIDAALEHYQTALKSNPNNPEAHNNAGVLLVQKKRFTEALEHFKCALALRPDYEKAINNLQKMEQIQK